MSSGDPDDTDMADDSSEQEFESPPETYTGPVAEVDADADADDDSDAVVQQLEASLSQAAPTTPTTSGIRRGRQYQARGIELLQNPPQFLAALRQTLFDVSTPVELKPEEFDLYWPFVDNIWVRQHKAGFDRSGKNRTDYYACRLQRPTYTPRKNEPPRDENKQRRKKRAREGGTCQMRIKTITYEGEFRKITISRIGEHTHTHDLDTLDRLKRNTVVMDIGRTEVMKGYMPTSVFNAMTADPVKLAMVGGKFFKVNDVRNASMHWRNNFTGALRSHPDAALSRNLSVMTSQRPPESAPSTSFEPENPEPSTRVDGEKSQQPPPLPADTLFFPPSSGYFLHPYLPPHPPPETMSPQLPHVTVAYATSLDSLISLGPRIPTPISGLPSKAMTHYLRSRHDAILIGVGTAICDDPRLNCRLAGAGGYGGVGWSSHPRPVIIDPGARWELTSDSKVLQAAKAGKARAPWIIVQPGAKVPTERVELLQQYGGRYLTLPEVNNRFRLPWEGILHALAQQEIKSVMIEGGGMVLNELLGREENSRLISSLILTIAPTYLGYGGVGITPHRRFNPVGTPVPVLRFIDVRWAPMGEDVVMCGRITRDLPQHTGGNAVHAPPALPPGQHTPPYPGGQIMRPPPFTQLSQPSNSQSPLQPGQSPVVAQQQPPQQQQQSQAQPKQSPPVGQLATPAQSQTLPSATAQLASAATAPTPNMTGPSPSPASANATPASVRLPSLPSVGGTPQTPTPMAMPMAQMPVVPSEFATQPGLRFLPNEMVAQAQAQENLRRRMQAHARAQPS